MRVGKDRSAAIKYMKKKKKPFLLFSCFAYRYPHLFLFLFSLPRRSGELDYRVFFFPFFAYLVRISRYSFDFFRPISMSTSKKNKKN